MQPFPFVRIETRSRNNGALMRKTSGKIAIAFLATASAACAVLLTGCAVSSDSAVSSPATIADTRLKGAVHGGQQPVSGATLQLYAAGNTGYGSAFPYVSGTSLLGSNVVTTDANGGFDISNDYTCPSSATPVYLVATGGNPGLANENANNNRIAVMAALGPCGSLSGLSFISMNELTTVASVWALAPFMTGISNIGASSTNMLGLTNAFAKVNKLVNVTTGLTTDTTLPAGGVLPVNKMNTLADILASCINSSGGTAGDHATNCGTLFMATTVNGVAPTDTVTAAMVMAQNPTTQVPTLVNLATPSAPFQPTYSGTPNDLSLVVTYTAGGLSSPSGVAIDKAANVWIANAGANSVTETDNTGTLLSGASGYSVGSLNAPAAIAVDQNGNAWVANKGNGTASQIAAGGGTGTVYTVGTAPTSIAIDAYGNAWTSNSTANSLSKITPSGVVTTVSVTGVAAPVGIAINPK